jgi:hypothetical protein
MSTDIQLPGLTVLLLRVGESDSPSGRCSSGDQGVNELLCGIIFLTIVPRGSPAFLACRLWCASHFVTPPSRMYVRTEGKQPPPGTDRVSCRRLTGLHRYHVKANQPKYQGPETETQATMATNLNVIPSFSKHA